MVSSLDFAFLDEIGQTDTVADTKEPAEEGASTLEPPSAFMDAIHGTSQICSTGDIAAVTSTRMFMDSPRRRKSESVARVPFFGTLSEDEREVHHRDHENLTGCRMNRVAFVEEVWSAVQCYETHSILKKGPNRSLMHWILEKLDDCEERLLLIYSANDESEANSPTKPAYQQNNDQTVYLFRTRKRTMRSKMVIEKLTV